MEQELKQKNKHLEIEFNNPVYDVIGEAIMKTALKHHFGEYDIAKLVMAVYDKDYGYLTSTDDYREQVKLLDNYFQKLYGHSLMTFEMVKTLKALEGTEIYDALTSEVASLETKIRLGDDVPASDLCIFSEPLGDNQYDELMSTIEQSHSFKYAMAIVYDKIKNIKK